MIQNLVLASIDHINNVKLKSHKHLCFTLELKSIIRAEVEKLHATKPPKGKPPTNDVFTHLYTVVFEVAPSGGIFESRVLYDKKTEKIQVHSDILRINLYGQSSSCIQDKYELRSFCYCISYHQKFKANLSSSNTTVAPNTSDTRTPRSMTTKNQ